MKTISARSYEYLPAIDGLRFYTVLLILANHIGLNRQVEGHALFFTLTGFLIHHITHREIIDKKYSFKNYMSRRILRTLPLYFTIVLFAGCAKIILEYLNIQFTVNDYWKYLLVIPNFSYSQNNFILANLWAVGVTEQFYIAWGLSFFLIRKWNFEKMFIILITGYLILLCTPIKITYGNPLVYLPNFLLGAIFSQFYNTYPKNDLIRIFFNSRVFAYMAYCIIILFLTLTFLYTSFDKYYLLRQSLLSIFFGCLILLVTYSKWNKIFISKPIRYFGKISYSFYCLHAIVIVITNKLVQHFQTPIHTIYSFTVVLCVTLFLSHLSYKYFEKRFLYLKKYFYNHSKM